MNYRKDVCPEETILKIKTILSDLRISYSICNEKSHKNLWWSLTVKSCDYPTICTNGKGCTRELALASGLAEFMERLQSGFLFDAKQPEEYGRYYNILNGAYKHYSNTMLRMMCGTNGLSSGNSFYEAFCQGFFEVLERYVLRLIFLTPDQIPIGLFEKELFKNTEAFEMISEIEKNGLLTYVVDGTCNGTLPVLGVIVVNPFTHCYALNMTSDYNVDICLKRCITELFQGRSLESFLKNTSTPPLVPIFDAGIDDVFYEFLKQVTASRGGVSCGILNQIITTISNQKNLEVFQDYKTSFECYERIKLLCKLEKITAFYCDLSCTSFFTCRVYVPGYSEIFESSSRTASRMRDDFQKTRDTIDLYINGEVGLAELINSIKTLLQYKVTRYQFPMHRLVPSEYSPHPELLSDDIMCILAILCLYQKNIEEAVMYATQSNSFSNPHHSKFILWYLLVKKYNYAHNLSYWYKENDGINQCIRSLDALYDNSVRLFSKRIPEGCRNG